jgi:PAS domain S-box-containing protein
MKDTSIRVLIIEGSEDDVLLIIRELKKGGYNPVYERVGTAASMKKALQEKQWDIILCDYSLPKFNAPSVIALLKETNIDIPLIVVTGTIGEETAAECMRLGAQDYIMKGNLSRLCPAIARELRQVKTKNRQKQMESQREAALEALRQSEEKHRTILENIEDGYYEVDIKGNFTFFNESMCRILGYSPEEMMGMNNRQFTDKENAKKLFQTFNKVYNTREPSKEFDWQVIRKDGTKRFIEVSVSLQKNSSGQPIGFQGVARDITERKQVEEALRESEALYQLLAEHMTDIVWIMDMDLNVIWLSPSAMKARGFSVDEIKALPLERQLTPDSIRKAFNWLGKLTRLEKDGLITEPDGIFSRELEFYRKDGSIIVLDCSFQFIRDEQGKVTGILAEGMDVTARKRAEDEVKMTLESLRKAFGTTIQIMVSAVEARDPYTAGHQLRSADLARAVAIEMGLDHEKIEGIRLAGSIHDIGKLSIPAEILSKPSKLTNIEFSLIKEHSRSGYEMLKYVESPWPLAEIVYQHHERIDGSGYPRNLKKDEILVEARIMAVADVVEAMASHRPYRAALGIEIALEEIEKNKGILYDNDVADACLRLFRKKGYSLVLKKS